MNPFNKCPYPHLKFHKFKYLTLPDMLIKKRNGRN